MNGKHTIDRCHPWEGRLLEIYDKQFKAAIIKVIQWAIIIVLETNLKLEILSKEIRKVVKKNRMYKKEPNETFKT